MYDDLVKRLRDAARWADKGLVITPNVCLEAADAIEELTDTNVGKWIPVTERLPERNKYVLVRYENNDMAVACIFESDENFTFWRAQTDEGWCADCDSEPTHWMPLPEPPEEE